MIAVGTRRACWTAMLFAAWGVSPAVGQDTKPWDPSAGAAEIKGIVKFSGEAPKRKPVDMGSEPACGALHTEPVLSETVIVNDNGTLKNAVVWIKTGLEGWKFPPPNQPASLAQKGCRYVPHVQVVQVGQVVKVECLDPFAHNVHGLPKQNDEFNFSQIKAGQVNEVAFSHAEVAVKVKCDIHGWMGAYIAVLPHPFFAVTGDDGSFKIAGLPPGEYTLEAWHEKLGTRTLVVKVGDKESKEAEVVFEKAQK